MGLRLPGDTARFLAARRRRTPLRRAAQKPFPLRDEDYRIVFSKVEQCLTPTFSSALYNKGEGGRNMNCSDCKHFRQHYIRYRKGVYRWCNFGHCVYPRIKQRIRTTPACEHFALLEIEGTPRAARRGMRGVL